MFHIHIWDEHYWELRNECSDLMSKWFLQLPLRTKLFLCRPTEYAKTS